MVVHPVDSVKELCYMTIPTYQQTQSKFLRYIIYMHIYYVI